MKHQLIPPPDMAPPSIKHLPVAEKVRLWARMVDEGDRLIMAGIRRRLGPEATEADVRTALLEWVDRRDAEHDRAIEHMIRELRRRERACGK